MKNQNLKIKIAAAKYKLEGLTNAEPEFPKGHMKSFDKGFGKWGKS